METSCTCSNAFEGGLELCDECKRQKIRTIQWWIENEAKFYGRTDEDFVLMFLYGCKFDLDKTKKKLHSYYENRKKLPQWWANINLEDPVTQAIIQLRLSTSVQASEEPQPQPTVAVAQLANINWSVAKFDDYMKVMSVLVEAALRRPNSQRHGVIMIFDCQRLPIWFVLRLLSPITAKHLINSTMFSCPVRLKAVITINSPSIVHVFYKLVHPLLPLKIRQRVHIFGSDWSKLNDLVPKELLPDEYGGCAGAFALHQDAFVEEIMSYTKYYQEDSKYGFY